MRKWMDRYYGRLRKVKLNYTLLNLVNRKRLRHAQRMLERHGIQRSAVLPLSSAHMPDGPGEVPWLDREDANTSVASSPAVKALPTALRQGVEHWPDKGYMIIRNCFTQQEVDAINAEVDALITGGKVDFNFTGRKIMFAFKHSALLKRIVHDERITKVLDVILGRKVFPFQSINFLTGSEQAPHSDTIHMTTYPLGYLAAAWIALEPMTPRNGPLVFYPGSHRLPYLLNKDYDHGGNGMVIGEEAYANYEKAVAERIASHELQPQEFIAEAGDVLIWHANLLHGGKKMAESDLSRKSMAIHYFAEDVLCYHELTQRAAWMDEDELARS